MHPFHIGFNLALIITGMTIVPVGSSGEILVSLWFLKGTGENWPSGNFFSQDFDLLYCTNEAKS
jgi:hypothetical protein